MDPNTSWTSVLWEPAVLITFIICACLAGVVLWLASRWQKHERGRDLAQQRQYQESTIERLMDAVADDKQQIIDEYELRLAASERQQQALEAENARLRDRMTSSGLLGLFGGKQRDVVSALLLENEQLHELVAQKQGEMRDMMADMTEKLLRRMEDQARESAQAVRYKQALLSAFLQHSETRALMDRLVAQGQLTAGEPAASSDETGRSSPAERAPDA